MLLRTALERTERLALVKITMRQRETLATIRAHDGVLTLHTMLWPDEIRTPNFDFMKEETNLTRQELNMATSLVENMSEAFAPEEFGDEYRQALQERIEAKAHGAEPAAQGRDHESDHADVLDLESALERSISHARGKKSTGSKGSSKKTSTGNTASSSKTTKKGSTRSKSSRSSATSGTGSTQGGSRKRGA